MTFNWFSDKYFAARFWQERFSKKGKIVYLLTAFLDRDRDYTGREINAFIKNNTPASLRSNSGFDVDHLRISMMENGFITRDADGSRYRVALDYSSPWEWLERAVPDPAQKYECPLCGGLFRGTQVLNHMHKVHNQQIEDIFERWLGTEG